MAYSNTEKSEIKKQAKEVAKILEDNFSEVEKQAMDAQTEFYKVYATEGKEKIMKALTDRNFSLNNKSTFPNHGGNNE